MITDQQARRLFRLMKREKKFCIAAAKSGMDEKTARKYVRSGCLPSQMKKDHDWRTRRDPYEDVWDEIEMFLEINPGLECKTLFEYLQRKYEGCFSDGQLRTLQRKIKLWRCMSGPPKEVFFAQTHYPGDLCASDFTSMNNLNVTICGEHFEHLLFHFVLTYSNWETGSICFSESLESLSAGLQNALWELGGVPVRHRSDNLSAAVYSCCDRKRFTDRYSCLLSHYGLRGETIEAGKPNQNGDSEKSHHLLKKAVDHILLLRVSRDFCSREEYFAFVRQLFRQLNKGRKDRFAEESAILKPLPARRLDDHKTLRVKVGKGSTVSILSNVYSVPSRLIGETVEARIKHDSIEIRYAQKKIDEFQRLRGKKKHRIEYRHIIDTLIRKPGAFANYRYRADLFPTTLFRMAYDQLKEIYPSKADKEYLKILHLAAKENQDGVNTALTILLKSGNEVSEERIRSILERNIRSTTFIDVHILKPEISRYDALLNFSRRTGEQ